MSSDSDDDFERFLQEDDSASVSSASPVKKKVTKKSKSKSKADTTSKSKSSAAASSSSTRRGSSGSSLSVVAAAEKLLVASGRAKAKPKQAIVEEDEDDEDEEPPPSYSEDPYAFELGAKSYLHHSDEENKESDDDLYDKRTPANKKDKTSKSSSKAAKKNKTKETQREKEPLATKRPEVKSTKTLEERVAEILKRTGSTTAMATTAAADEEKDDEEDDDENDDDGDYKQDEDDDQANATPTHALAGATGTSAATKTVMEDNDRSGSDDDGDGDGSDLHRLSFSDSLGMESADFESSLNSEKFAVNLDALEESELPAHNRYDRRDDDYAQSLGTSDAADGSDYGDDGFELDQTTDGMAAAAPKSNSEAERSVAAVEEPSSFLSEFEKMKKFFSVESPEKPPPDTDAISEPVHQQPPSLAPPSLPPPPPPPPPLESDTFGYDDDDFETDELKASIYAKGNDEAPDLHPMDPPTGDDAYGDDGFEGDEQESANAVEQQVNPLHFVSLDNPPLEPMLRIHAVEVPSREAVASTNATTPCASAPDAVALLGLHVPSSTEERVPPQANPPRPRSPPPPPPPEEDDDLNTAKPPPLLSLPQSQIQQSILQPQRQAPPVVDRFREIDQQVASLRFLRDSTRPPPPSSAAVALVDPPVQVDVIADAAMAEEMKEIEQLMEQARRVRKERRRSISVRSSAKESGLALRLQQAQRQLLQFKHHVQELAERDDDDDDDEIPLDRRVEQDDVEHSGHADEARGVEGHTPEGTPQKKKRETLEATARRKENEQLKKEVETQERLIQGFQRENEQLMKQLKQLQRDLHYDVHKENESLRLQLRELRTRLDRAPYSNRDAAASTTDPEDKSTYRAAIEGRLHAEALAESLHEDLSAQAKRHQAAVNELKIELEKAKKAKIDLECQYEGLDLQKMENEIQQTKLLKDQIRMQKTEHDHALAALQKKLDWYVANQRLLDDQDDKMKALKEENEQLKRERESWNSAEKPRAGGSVSGVARSPITPGKSGAGRSAADIRRIQELETRLSEMEAAMRRRHPDSLVSLIVASRKAEEESTIHELRTEHELQLEALAEEMERAQANHEKKLNAFRQQQEKLVLQYQKQVAGLERQLANKENQRNGGGGGGGSTNTAAAWNLGRNARKPTTTATTDETELYRVRRFYAEKIKELERKWEAKYRSLKKQHYAATGSGSGGAGDMEATVEHDERAVSSSSWSSDSARVIRSLQQQVKAQEDELRRLRVASSGSDSRTQTTTNGWETSDLRRRVQSLEHQLKTSEDARCHLVETLTSLDAIAPTTVAAPVQDPNAESKTEQEITARLQTMKDGHDTELARYRQQIATLEQQVVDQSTAAHTLRNQFSVHIKEVERLQTMLTEAEREKKMLQATAERVPTLESEVSVLREHLAVPQTPSMLQFRSLELRIETLAQKHQLREAELKTMLVQATQSSQLEKLQYERMYEKALALKNHEILTFKKQLEEILDELELLRASQAHS